MQCLWTNLQKIQFILNLPSWGLPSGNKMLSDVVKVTNKNKAKHAYKEPQLNVAVKAIMVQTWVFFNDIGNGFDNYWNGYGVKFCVFPYIYLICVNSCFPLPFFGSLMTRN